MFICLLYSVAPDSKTKKCCKAKVGMKVPMVRVTDVPVCTSWSFGHGLRRQKLH